MSQHRTEQTRNRPARRASRGMALPTALLVMIVLTLLGTAAVFTSSTDLSIAGNGRSEIHALSVAEAGVHEAFARLNTKTVGHVDLITPGVDGGNNPVATWERTIVNKSVLGATEVQTKTGNFGTPTALPFSTTIRYKKEATENPVSHCSGGCNDEVVRFHTNFGYAGTLVPTGAQQAGGVLQIESVYTAPGGGSRTIVVEAVRTIATVNSPGAVRACTQVTCSGSPGTVNGTQHPTGGAVVGFPAPSGCNDTRVDPDPSGDPDAVQSEACPATDAELFEQTFGVDKAQMLAMADLVKPAPYKPLNNVTGEIIYITGAGTSIWDGNTKIGTTTSPACTGDPVIAIVDGDLTIAGTVTFCGILYVTGNFTLGAGTLRLRGAMVSQARAPATLTLTGNSSFTYDPDVMGKIPRLTPYTTILWNVN